MILYLKKKKRKSLNCQKRVFLFRETESIGVTQYNVKIKFRRIQTRKRITLVQGAKGSEMLKKRRRTKR